MGHGSVENVSINYVIFGVQNGDVSQQELLPFV